MPRGDKHLHGGAREGAGRRPSRAVFRKGFRLGVCLDSVNVTYGEIYDIERLSDTDSDGGKIIRWRSEDGAQTLVIFAPDA